jgi:Secretion system C-terminal sorting domain
MILKNIAVFIFCLQSTFLLAQVPYGHEKAIYKDSSIFISWATGCTVDRGFQNISDSFLGLASTGDSLLAIGKADGSGVVSLGDAGTAILSFQSPITNGAGYDFAVFENGFSFGVDSLFFLELAFVEVSSDGQHYFRFPSTSLTDTIIQIDNASGINPKGINNLAGKYSVNYGTPFDLDELKNLPGLDINNITNIKVIDVVGSLDNSIARKDASGRKINDPWPTPFPSSGFDLDAIGVIHQKWQSGISDIKNVNELIKIFPNPAKQDDELHIIFPESLNVSEVQILDLTGKLLWMQPNTSLNLTIGLSQFDKGIYLLKITGQDFETVKKIIIE